MIRRMRRVFPVLFLFLAGCASAGREIPWSEPGIDLVWPEPPETPRLRYLRTLTTDLSHAGNREGRFFRWMTGEVPSPRLQMPYGVAADGRGRVWVADGGARRVYALDLGRGRTTVLSHVGEEPFVFPVGLAHDREREQLFISDSGSAKVFRLTTSGRFLGEVRPPGGFRRPGGLGVDGEGNLYAADVLRGTVEVFSPDGKYLRTLGSGVTRDGRFNRPANVAVDPEGHVHVVDALNFRVEILSADGKSLSTVGGVGDTPGRFARPRGIALDSEGNIYVADAAFDNIQIFSSTGDLLLVLGRGGRGKGEFCMPAGLGTDPQDRLYVVDSCNSRIQVFQLLK